MVLMIILLGILNDQNHSWMVTLWYRDSYGGWTNGFTALGWLMRAPDRCFMVKHQRLILWITREFQLFILRIILVKLGMFCWYGSSMSEQLYRWDQVPTFAGGYPFRPPRLVGRAFNGSGKPIDKGCAGVPAAMFPRYGSFSMDLHYITIINLLIINHYQPLLTPPSLQRLGMGPLAFEEPLLTPIIHYLLEAFAWFWESARICVFFDWCYYIVGLLWCNLFVVWS